MGGAFFFRRKENHARQSRPPQHGGQESGTYPLANRKEQREQQAYRDIKAALDRIRAVKPTSLACDDSFAHIRLHPTEFNRRRSRMSGAFFKSKERSRKESNYE